MDDAAVGAAGAVRHSDTTQAEQWFDVIGEAYGESADADWPAFTAALRERAFAASFDSDTVDEFVTYVESVSSEPIAVVAQLADPGERDAVLRAYTESVDAADEAEAVDDEAVDDDLAAGEPVAAEPVAEETAAEDAPADETPAAARPEWIAYLARWNDQWDGRDETWDEFATRLTYYAPAGFEDTANRMVAYLAGQQDRVAALEDYGITVATGPAAAAEPDEPADTVAEDVEAEIVEKVFEPAMARLFDNVDTLAAQLGMTPDELRAEIDGLPAEFFAEVIAEAVTEPA